MIAGPEGCAGGAFPDKVQIHGKCGEMCMLETTAFERLLLEKIVKGLATFVSSGTPTKMVQSDILIAIQTTHSDGMESFKYCFISGISSKGGFNKPDAVHVSCRCLNESTSSDHFESQVHSGSIYCMFIFSINPCKLF